MLLEVDQLVKHFPVRQGILRRPIGRLKAVDGISFHLERGEVLGIVGESGCGKSTAGRAAIRLLEPTSGSIRFDGQDLLSLKSSELRRLRPRMQMVFQNPLASLNPRKTIRQSLCDPLQHHGRSTDNIPEMLDRVGLSEDVLGRYPHQFSGGQQQRICIARALALEPDLLVCDEAVSALDVSVQSQILQLLQDLRNDLNLSYLFISHDLSVVRYLCDRVLVLYLGKVVESGPTEEVFANPCHPYTQALLSAIPRSHPGEPSRSIPMVGELPSPLNPPSGCPFRTRCPHASQECELPPPTRSVREQVYSCIL